MAKKTTAKKRAKRPSVKKRASKKASTAGAKRLTTKATEQDFETEIRLAVRKAFPWLEATDVKHQVKFSFNVGHAVLTVDGKRTYRAEGRADVLIETKGSPLAILELKRPGNPLTATDELQGLSYARLLPKMAPLVLVTNGTEARLIATHSGEEWNPPTRDATELAKLLKAASKAAAGDVKKAVEVLLGTDQGFWGSALRQTTTRTLNDLSGPWSNSLRPFVPDFLLPRDSTQTVLRHLRAGAKTVIVEGAPLSGKSSALRELALATADSKEFVVLFVEADGFGPGIFQRLANELASALAWPVTADEVRLWLRQLSKVEGPALVLALDGPTPGNAEFRKDIEELGSASYDKNLRLVISVDTDAAGYIFSPNTRKESALGRSAEVVEVLPLNDGEFEKALKLLWKQHYVGLMKGAEKARELRSPSILRALIAPWADDPRHLSGKSFIVLPPLLSLSLIGYARSMFPQEQLRTRLGRVAAALLDDAGLQTRPVGLVLEAFGAFLVQRETLERYLNARDIEALVSDGVLKPRLHVSGVPVFSVRLPELLASELALRLAEEVTQRYAQSPSDAASWLTETANRLPLGDIIGAQAIWDALHGEVPIRPDLLKAFLRVPPRPEPMAPGGVYSLGLPGGKSATPEPRSDGSVLITAHGEQSVLQPEEGEDLGEMIADMGAWLLLSHLVSKPLRFQDSEGSVFRADPWFILELATCGQVLRGPQNDPKDNLLLVHNVPGHGSVLCQKAGIVEPVTLAIYNLLASDWSGKTEWLQDAVSRQSFALLMRLYSAASELGSGTTAESVWARAILKKTIKPALDEFPLLH
jgi:hypothetical protein